MIDGLLTCIINVKNGERYIEKTIKSLLTQVTSVKILAIDNFSTDNTKILIKKYPQIRYELPPEPMSLGKARNYSLGLVDTKYVAWVDADDLWLPETAGLLVGYLEKNSEAGAAHVSAWCVDENEEPLPSRKQLYISDDSGSAHECDDTESILRIMRPDGPWCSYVFCTEIVRKVGGFDPMFTHAEDFDLLLKIGSVSKLFRINYNGALYRIHATQNTRTQSPDIVYGEFDKILDLCVSANYKVEKELIDNLRVVNKFKVHAAHFLQSRSLTHLFEALLLLRYWSVLSWCFALLCRKIMELFKPQHQFRYNV